MLGLLLCAVLSEWFQPGVISQSFSSLVVHNDRTYKDAPVNFQGQLLVTLFRIGTLAMMLCLCWAPEGQFTYPAFWAVFGLTLLVLILKMLCHLVLDYTFTLNRRFGAPYEHYSNLFTLVAIVLFPTLPVLVRLSMPSVARWCLLVTGGLFILIWLYRCIRTYITSFAALIYVLIYICTLELLPYAGLSYISAKTLSAL